MNENKKHTANENEKKTLIVIIFTIIMMAAEIIYGYITNSMALLADGLHMGTHAFALLLTFAAYILIRKFDNSPHFPNGTDKIGVLAGYTSAVFLAMTGIWIIYEAVKRIISPIQIQFNEALIVAIIGFVVNFICILIMEGSHEHEHKKDCDADYNFKSAYYHILADILTSVLAICALFLGKYFNIICLDSIVGFLGGILILKWSAGLIKDTVRILIDMK